MQIPMPNFVLNQSKLSSSKPILSMLNVNCDDQSIINHQTLNVPELKMTPTSRTTTTANNNNNVSRTLSRHNRSRQIETSTSTSTSKLNDKRSTLTLNETSKSNAQQENDDEFPPLRTVDSISSFNRFGKLLKALRSSRQNSPETNRLYSLTSSDSPSPHG